MSILAPTQQPEISRAERKANRLKQGAKQMTEGLVQQWEQLFSTLWEDENPQEVLDALGTDAAELFELNTALVTFMATSLAGKRDDIVAAVTAKVAAIPANTINPDGTVTITVVPEG